MKSNMQEIFIYYCTVYAVVTRAVARILWGGGSWANINLAIKTFMQNFKIENNCIANF